MGTPSHRSRIGADGIIPAELTTDTPARGQPPCRRRSAPTTYGPLQRLPHSPLRLHGTNRVTPVPSPKLGQHNLEIYGGWLGLGAEGVEALKRDGVI